MKTGLKFLLGSIASLVSLLVLWLFFPAHSIPGHRSLRAYLKGQLVRYEPLPENVPTHVPKTTIYVLGGTQSSLKAKFKTAAALYQRGSAQKILLLNDPGVTEYDPLLGRNLTNNEWVTKTLRMLGVNVTDIEFVRLPKRFFGTLTEAERIAAVAANRGYRRLILVTSDHHTLRTWLTFSHFLKKTKVDLYVYASNEQAPLRELFLEYVKLFLYKNVLLTQSSSRAPQSLPA